MFRDLGIRIIVSNERYVVMVNFVWMLADVARAAPNRRTRLASTPPDGAPIIPVAVGIIALPPEDSI